MVVLEPLQSRPNSGGVHPAPVGHRLNANGPRRSRWTAKLKESADLRSWDNLKSTDADEEVLSFLNILRVLSCEYLHRDNVHSPCFQVEQV
jgi:hypothetical protein